MKKIISLGVVSLGLLLLFSGCDSVSTDKEASNSSSAKKSESTEVVSSSVPETTQSSSDFKFEKTFAANWSEDWHGLTTKIDSVKIVEPRTPEKNIDGSTTALAVGINFTITNNSDRDIMVYPNQGNVVIDSQQGNANMASSTNDLGGTISPGVTKTGVVAYSIQNHVDAASLKSLRVLWKATDTKVEDVNDYSKDYDVALNLQ